MPTRPLRGKTEWHNHNTYLSSPCCTFGLLAAGGNDQWFPKALFKELKERVSKGEVRLPNPNLEYDGRLRHDFPVDGRQNFIVERFVREEVRRCLYLHGMKNAYNEMAGSSGAMRAKL